MFIRSLAWAHVLPRMLQVIKLWAPTISYLLRFGIPIQACKNQPLNLSLHLLRPIRAKRPLMNSSFSTSTGNILIIWHKESDMTHMLIITDLFTSYVPGPGTSSLITSINLFSLCTILPPLFCSACTFGSYAAGPANIYKYMYIKIMPLSAHEPSLKVFYTSLPTPSWGRVGSTW